MERIEMKRYIYDTYTKRLHQKYKARKYRKRRKLGTSFRERPRNRV